MRWIWIDRFDEFHGGRSAVAIKNLSTAEDHLHHQYPGWPVMPCSLIVEGLAQTGGILVGEANDFREKVVLAKIPKVMFHDYAVAGDLLRYEVELLELRDEGGIVAGKVVRDGETIAEAEIFFAHLDQSRGVIDGMGEDNFVFTKDHLLALVKTARVRTERAPAPGPSQS